MKLEVFLSQAEFDLNLVEFSYLHPTHQQTYRDLLKGEIFEPLNDREVRLKTSWSQCIPINTAQHQYHSGPRQALDVLYVGEIFKSFVRFSISAHF